MSISKRTINRRTRKRLIDSVNEVDPDTEPEGEPPAFLPCRNSLLNENDGGLSDVLTDASQDHLSGEERDNETDNTSGEEIDNETDNTEDDFANMSIADGLLLFMMMFNISNAAMNFLLLFLNCKGIEVPKSSHGLKGKLKRHIMFDSRVVEKGDIGFCSIVTHLSYCFQKGFLKSDGNNLTEITLHFNLDGLPLFKSSRLNLWPLLMTVKECTYPKPFPLAFFCGVEKPNIEIFLSKMIEDLRALKEIMKVDDVFVKVKKVVFICDAPARAFVQCIKGHSAKDGCGYCRWQGIFENGRIVFPFASHETLSSLSRNASSYDCFSESNQLSLSPLAGLVDIRNDFVPEYMHCVCLGVFKKMCSFYFVGAKGIRLPCKLSYNQKEILSKRINDIRKQLPSEFNRRLRDLKNFEFYKATEFRTLLLYLGPYLFADCLPKDFYHNFLLLHFSIYCFASPTHCRLNFDIAKACIQNFCQEIVDLYQKRLSSYNSHILMHLPDFVRINGPLDNWSSFLYENYLGIIKRRLRPTRHMFTYVQNTLSCVLQLFSNSLTSNTSITYTLNTNDNCSLLCNGNVIIVSNVSKKNGKTLLSGRLMKLKRPLYKYPYCSYETMRIGYYNLTHVIVTNCEPMAKCIIFKHTDSSYVVIPMVSPDRAVD